MNAMDKTYIRKEPKGVVAVLGKHMQIFIKPYNSCTSNNHFRL